MFGMFAARDKARYCHDRVEGGEGDRSYEVHIRIIICGLRVGVPRLDIANIRIIFGILRLGGAEHSPRVPEMDELW